MGSLARKQKRNELRNLHGNKNLRNEWKGFQINKYGLVEYSKICKKSINQIFTEK
jgi:hypothetical protein